MPKETASDDVDVEVLIEEVRGSPEIWDVSNEDHRDKLKKRAAWFGLCRKFTNDFDEKSEAEKNDFCNKLMNKWRNVKDNYYRYVKKRAQLGSKAGRSYLYAKHLSFLPAAHHWPASNLDVPETYSENSDSVPIEPITTSQASDSASAPRPAKRRRENASSPIHVISAAPSSNQIPSMDEDRMFFESLIPTVRTFDMDQKLEFRMEVMQLLKRVRLMTFQQYECQNCGHDGTELQQTSYRGRPVRSRMSSKRAVAASPATYQAPVTYLMQDLHPDCVQKYDDDDSLEIDD